MCTDAALKRVSNFTWSVKNRRSVQWKGHGTCTNAPGIWIRVVLSCEWGRRSWGSHDRKTAYASSHDIKAVGRCTERRFVWSDTRARRRGEIDPKLKQFLLKASIVAGWNKHVVISDQNVDVGRRSDSPDTWRGLIKRSKAIYLRVSIKPSQVASQSCCNRCDTLTESRRGETIGSEKTVWQTVYFVYNYMLWFATAVYRLSLTSVIQSY